MLVTTTFWILITVSHGVNNTGNVDVIAKFTEKKDCQASVERMPLAPFKAFCIEAKNVVK